MILMWVIRLAFYWPTLGVDRLTREGHSGRRRGGIGDRPSVPLSGS
jgi:hypothetical protein